MRGRLDSDLDKNIELNPIVIASNDVREAATLVVCAYATDVTEAHYLLIMLGLEERS